MVTSAKVSRDVSCVHIPTTPSAGLFPGLPTRRKVRKVRRQRDEATCLKAATQLLLLKPPADSWAPKLLRPLETPKRMLLAAKRPEPITTGTAPSVSSVPAYCLVTCPACPCADAVDARTPYSWREAGKPSGACAYEHCPSLAAPGMGEEGKPQECLWGVTAAPE
ncbi:uncharacterized protein LOC124901104 isoform X2 [Homo sapiens]|uniref:uncharacterized protein LOC124901104 isoform X2 n=1 Tax=Homo sapiens TaxID=9606 RepID=UPI001FB17990|nr:uncharacterized protein LOC124901104 isoform X2 [Homo sapiens]XP_047300521.1 uncharacterized protein LOC124901104 isoform X2 [Homo sapiens]